MHKPLQLRQIRFRRAPSSRSCIHCVATDYTVPNPNCCKNGSVFSAARCPSAIASSAR